MTMVTTVTTVRKLTTVTTLTMVTLVTTVTKVTRVTTVKMVKRVKTVKTATMMKPVTTKTKKTRKTKKKKKKKIKIEKIRSILECWKFRRLTLLGKIAVLKSLVASQLVYIFSPLQTNHEAIKEINTIFYKFLWNDKGDKIKRKIMINDYSEGGLKMIDIASFNKSLKATWIQKYLDPESRSKWKRLFDSELERNGGEVILKGNLNKKDVNNLKISDPFVKEILVIWSEVFFRETIVSEEHLLSSPLWQNSLIRIQNKPVFYKDWLAKGITQVKHLMDESSNFFSLAAFQIKYNLQVRPLTFFGLISAVNRLRRQNTKTQSKYENRFSKFLMSQKPSKFIYQEIVSKNCERPISCQEKWRKDINLNPKEIINWKVAYQTSFQCTKSSKLITFNFKLLHRRLPTNGFLKKVGLREDDKCSFCNKETENLIHLFWRCEKTKNFWDSLFKWMQSCQLSLSEHNYLHINTALGLRPDRSKHKLQINFCCLLAKHHIWLCRSKEHPPNLNNFLHYLKHIYQIENNASTVKNKWEPLLPYISLLT